MLRTLTVSKRLNFVNGLFGVGLLIIGGLGLWVQWNAMRAQRAEALTTLTRYAAAAIDHERADAEKNNLSEDVAKAHALAAIAAMRDGPDGYFSVANENGVLLYHPDPKVVGTDMTKVADSNGFHFVADVIPRTIRDGSATVWYSFPRVGSTTPVTKLTAYVYYKPWHWLISTGTYMDTMYADFWQSAGKLLLVGLLMLITIYGLVMLVIRSIVRPLLSINRAMGAVASGRLDIDVPEAKFGGEIGAMGAAVVTFRDAAVEKRRLEMEAEATQTRLEADRARQAEIEAAAAQQQQFVVSELAGGLARLANGDLTSHLSQPFSPEYEALRTDYNRAVAQLHATIGAIIANIGNLRSGAGEITNAADDLSRRTEQQAASLEETAAALDEVTATVKKAAEGARQARDLVATTKTGAEKSGQVVRDAIGAMSAIENSATQITQIIGVIDEIAFQTNLLALNAGVEAARAGDAGRGFAVVASEVRALAQRSAQAAKEIKALISSSTQHVGQGVNLVGATGTSLTDIVTQIGKINNLITEIAGSSEEQATALHQVNTAINQMDQVTQQNAAMVEQSTAASHSLSEDSETLLQLISKFRVADAAEPGKIVRFAKPARTERVMAAAPPQRSRTGSRPAVAAKDASVRNSDRWQEF